MIDPTSARFRNYIDDWDLLPPERWWKPLGWKYIPPEGAMPDIWVHKSGLGATLSAGLEGDPGERWLHLSVSHKHHVPTYTQMTAAKDAFLGDRLAYSLWVPRTEHVTFHPNCLHIWAPLDHRPTPDFRPGEGMI